jgi:hypothetical protein
MFTEDLDAFLDVDEFATEATYDGAATILGIFDNGASETTLGLAGVVGTAPQFLCKASDVDTDPAGKELVIGETTWTIVRGEPDGTGLTRLILTT